MSRGASGSTCVHASPLLSECCPNNWKAALSWENMSPSLFVFVFSAFVSHVLRRRWVCDSRKPGKQWATRKNKLFLPGTGWRRKLHPGKRRNQHEAPAQDTQVCSVALATTKTKKRYLNSCGSGSWAASSWLERWSCVNVVSRCGGFPLLEVQIISKIL